MHKPRAFAHDDREDLCGEIERIAFGTLLSVSKGDIVVSHVPFMVERTNRVITLRGHIAKANPHWQSTGDGDPGLAIFTGPNAYVSPGWYPSKAEHGRVVPTWNYTAIHASGPLRWSHERGELLKLVAGLTEQHEAGQAQPWATSDAPEEFITGLLDAIVGFELTVEQLEGVRKLSQNRPQPDREAVAARLSQSDLSGDRDVGAAMLKLG
jgi:transcriptional regulator